ncbi:all-trans retinoic acid-induced differentiation factor [Parasteatoda tepidariorum]|uniref:all-trans retinoic acid-induced differentiation factor n=1 Tax=Parasteatoda tepidariorum TaxID=114398 RepID=UPI00077FB8DC|nr:all-trans retinoic acid-induced differentiation factor [Parasteatoda tepidariorum]
MNNMLFLISFTLILCLSKTFALEDCPVYFHCNNTLITEDSKVNSYCQSVYDKNVTGRCCNVNDTIIGLDLRYCDIKILNISHAVFSEIEILDLRENDYDKFTADELLGLLKLNDLYLEAHIPCPGGDAAWNHTYTEKTETYCKDQLDYCESIKHMNIFCGTGLNAKCLRLGPGSAKCDCQPGYFGYKCLQQGIFPSTVFVSSLVIPTIVLSVTLWFIQGRDPYRMRSTIVN